MSQQLRFTLTALILGLTLGLGLPLLALAADDAPVLSFKPAQAELQPGQTLTAEVWLENAPEIYGFEVHITFDPAVLEVVDADPTAAGIQLLPGDFISPSQQSFTIRNQADNVTGTLEYAITLMNPAPSVQGAGRLFNIAFRAIVSGTAAVSITDKSLLGTRAGETIAPIRQGLLLNAPAAISAVVSNSGSNPGAAAPSAPTTNTPVLLAVGVSAAALLVGGALAIRKRRAH